MVLDQYLVYFVGFKQQNPITVDYFIYLPSKNVFITSSAEQESQQSSNIAKKVRRSERLLLNTNLVTVPKETKWEKLVANTVYS